MKKAEISHDVWEHLHNSMKYSEKVKEYKEKADFEIGMAFTIFLKDNGLDKTVVNKKTGERGKLQVQESDYGMEINFFPIRLNGKISKKRSINSTTWVQYKSNEDNFQSLVDTFEAEK